MFPHARRGRGIFTSLAFFSAASALSFVAGCSDAASSSGVASESIGQTGQRMDARVRAMGRLMCRNTPLANVRVDMMNSNSDTDTVSDQQMGTGYTDANGYFSFEGVGGDSGSWSWSRPDVYVRAVYDGYVGFTRVRVTNELDNARSDNTPQHSHDNQSAGSVVQIGERNFDSLDCVIWQNSMKAVQDYQAVTGMQIPSGKYDIERWEAIFSGTPWTNRDTTHWPTNYPAALSTSFHEFGHSVRHSLDGDQDHFNWDVTRFRYARNHSWSDKTNEGFAFNEGWAEYWETRGGSGVATVSPANDWEIEGNVAYELKRLSDCAGVGPSKMVDVLRAHPGAIHSMNEFRQYFDQANPNACRPRFPPNMLVAGEASEAIAPETTVRAEPGAPASIDAIRAHVADGSYDAWKASMRATIIANALTAKRASVHAAIAAIGTPTDDAARAHLDELRTSLTDVDAIEASIARGEPAPIGLVP